MKQEVYTCDECSENIPTSSVISVNISVTGNESKGKAQPFLINICGYETQSNEKGLDLCFECYTMFLANISDSIKISEHYNLDEARKRNSANARKQA